MDDLGLDVESRSACDRKFRAAEWTVAPVDQRDAVEFIESHHYAKGASKTSVFRFGLFEHGAQTLRGVTMWLPPTRVAAESVVRGRWRRVLSLSRMAVSAYVPKNGASFLLGASVRAIRRDGRFSDLVTYADEGAGHTGHVYRASNWSYCGPRPGATNWTDPSTGRRVSAQATKTRTVAEMRALGFSKLPRMRKHKFILHLEPVDVEAMFG